MGVVGVTWDLVGVGHVGVTRVTCGQLGGHVGEVIWRGHVGEVGATRVTWGVTWGRVICAVMRVESLQGS